MKYEYANRLPEGMSIEEYYDKLRAWLDKKITRIIDPIEQTLKSGEITVYVDTDENGMLVKHWFDITVDLTPEQITALNELNTTPDLWVEENYANRFSFKTQDSELITLALENAVPGKGLMYNGKHGDIGFNSLVELTDEEKALAVAAWLAYGKWL